MISEVITAGEAMGMLLAENGATSSRTLRFARGIAGAESNVAIALARLGHTVSFLGRVGADPMGAWIGNQLRAEGVGLDGLEVDLVRPTGLLLRDAPAGGLPCTVTYLRKGSAASAMDHTLARAHADAIRTARAVHCSGITAMLSSPARRFAGTFFDLAIAGGAHVFFDPNVRTTLAPASLWASMLKEFIGRPDTVVLSQDEVPLFGGDVESLLVGRTSAVVVKRAALGARVYTAEGFTEIPARPVRVLDPVGAGDAFVGGWISAWLRGAPPQQALSEAVTVASCVVAVAGDIDGLPTARERDLLLRGTVDVQR